MESIVSYKQNNQERSLEQKGLGSWHYFGVGMLSLNQRPPGKCGGVCVGILTCLLTEMHRERQIPPRESVCGTSY